MAFRTIDATATWQGDIKALQVFKRAFDNDCAGDIAKFQAAYGWTLAATELALSRAPFLNSQGETQCQKQK